MDYLASIASKRYRLKFIELMKTSKAHSLIMTNPLENMLNYQLPFLVHSLNYSVDAQVNETVQLAIQLHRIRYLEKVPL